MATKEVFEVLMKDILMFISAIHSYNPIHQTMRFDIWTTLLCDFIIHSIAYIFIL